MKKLIILFSILFQGLTLVAQKGFDLSKYNVVWDTPSEDSFGSMPLGNGDIGLNVWVEKNGDILFGLRGNCKSSQNLKVLCVKSQLQK
jgi:hypothetical protein